MGMSTLPVAIDAAATSDTGRVREHNEDAIWLDTFFREGIRSARFAREEQGSLLLAVADGVGGAAAGEVASQWVCEQMAASIESVELPAEADELSSRLKKLARDVNEGLEREASARRGARGMATTYTGLLFVGERTWWINAGDSRLYELRDGSLAQISRDHTLREELGDPSIPGNIITNCFGHQDGFRLDAGQLPSDPPDLYLICSDGLSDYADMSAVEGVLRGAAASAAEASDLEAPARELVNLALAGGGGDNVTVLIARPIHE